MSEVLSECVVDMDTAVSRTTMSQTMGMAKPSSSETGGEIVHVQC